MRDDFEKRLKFEWDEGNSDKNWVKHKVANKEVEEVFADINAIVSLDTKHSKYELRWLLLGETKRGRLLSIFFTVRKLRIRVISARPASKKERNLYEKEA